VTPEQRTALRRIDRQFDAVRTMPEPIPPRERYQHGIEDVREGGYLRCAGQLYQVVGISEYRERGESWSELEVFSLTSGGTTYLEWEKDDEVEISLNGPELSLSEIGVSADQVEAMSEEEEGRISFDGRSYHYDDDYGATYFRGDAAEGEKVYFYDFETKDEKYCLTVEEWGDESAGYEYVAFVSEYIEPDAIEVLVLATDGAGS
jgi:hypothetical protein